ncbi:MAG: hypothetical protein WCC11_04150 [Gammaproteobacteria bacterium]
MTEHFLRLTLYGRGDAIRINIEESDYAELMDGVKALAAGQAHVPAFYLFPVSPILSVLISVKEIQFLQSSKQPNGHDWTPVLQAGGVAFYLRGREHPLVLDYSGKGPLDDMFHGLATATYSDEVPGCIMLADGAGDAVFFRLDEVQFAVVRTELIQRPS